jgi:hypothetical protein
MRKRFGYLAFAGAGIGFFVGLMYARPGHGALPGLALGALLGVLIELFAIAADRLTRDKSDGSSHAR